MAGDTELHRSGGHLSWKSGCCVCPFSGKLTSNAQNDMPVIPTNLKHIFFKMAFVRRHWRQKRIRNDLSSDEQDAREKASVADEEERHRGRRAGSEGWQLHVCAPGPWCGFAPGGFGRQWDRETRYRDAHPEEPRGTGRCPKGEGCLALCWSVAAAGPPAEQTGLRGKRMRVARPPRETSAGVCEDRPGPVLGGSVICLEGSPFARSAPCPWRHISGPWKTSIPKTPVVKLGETVQGPKLRPRLWEERDSLSKPKVGQDAPPSAAAPRAPCPAAVGALGCAEGVCAPGAGALGSLPARPAWAGATSGFLLLLGPLSPGWEPDPPSVLALALRGADRVRGFGHL